MKQLVLSLLVACSILLHGKNPESLPTYIVQKAIPDKSLNRFEARIKITFYAGEVLKSKVIKLSANGDNKTITTDAKGVISRKSKPGKTKFQFYLDEDHYEIYTDSIDIKGGFMTPISVYFQSSKYPVMVEKPVIYFYAKDTVEVKVKLDPKVNLTFCYPPYNNEWSIKATSGGDVICDEKKYPYLFWEGNTKLSLSNLNTCSGFLATKENLTTFFEEKLSLMGFNGKEKTDFITYWCPRMAMYNSVYINFFYNDEVNKFADMQLKPKPDNLFRLYVLWVPFDKIDVCTDMSEPKLQSFRRSGLTVVEWGGSEIVMPAN